MHSFPYIHSYALIPIHSFLYMYIHFCALIPVHSFPCTHSYVLILMFLFPYLYSVDERQVILKAGHPSYFSYLLISGSVFVNIIDEDPNTGKKCYRTTRVLQEGALFGVSDNVTKYGTVHVQGGRERRETKLTASHL